MRHRILLILFTAAIGSANAQPAGDVVEEVRGVWVTNVASNVLHSKANIAQAMDYLAANGINVIFPVVWNKGETQYVSPIMQAEFNRPIESFFLNQSRDPLAELIVEAHRNGMEVMPWFEFGFSTSFSSNGGHILAKYPHWAAINSSGQLVVKNGFDWMNGLHPEPQNFMLSLIHEVIDRYDVDGVQGDDRLPAMPTEGGYDPWTLQQYRAEHNGANPPTNTKDLNWLYWRSDRLVNFLGRWYRSVKEKDPNLMVSLSPSVWQFGFFEYLQEIPLWLDSSYVDMLHPQLYPPNRTGPDFGYTRYTELLRAAVGPIPNSSGGYVKRQYRDKLSPGMLIRAGNEVVPPTVIRQMVRYNREFGINGEVYFFYEGMGAFNQFLADSLGRNEYRRPAVLPVRNRTVRRPPAVIVNETDVPNVQRTGNWQLVGPAGLTPGGYRDRSLRAEAGSGAEMLFVADVPYDAHYRVFAYVPHSTAGTTTARYITYSNGGADSTVTVINQALPRNGGWMPIGNVRLDAGLNAVVRIRANDVTDGKPIHADAVMLLLDRKQSKDLVIPVPTSIDRESGAMESPTGITLEQNYPNPFNPSTVIGWRLAVGGEVSLNVYDTLGRLVATLVDETLPAGNHRATFDASGLASGLYLYRLDANGETATKVMTLIQ